MNPSDKTVPFIEVLDCPVSWVSMAEVRQQALLAVDNQSQTTIVAANAEKIMHARKHRVLKNSLEEATIVLPDGIGCVLAARILDGTRLDRVCGADVMPELCDVANSHGLSIFLLGATEAVNEQTARQLVKRFPNLIIAGRRNGYMTDDETSAVIQQINDSGAQFLFIGLGTPRQEFWLQEHKHALKPVVIQTVGGSFDVISGTVRRAPKLFRQLNLEWFYRLMSQPSRIHRQTALPRFIVLLLREKMSRRQRRRIDGRTP